MLDLKGAALTGVAQWIEREPTNQRVAGLIPSQAHAWVAGQVPSRRHVRGNHMLMVLSLSFSTPSPLSKNKQIKSLKIKNKRDLRDHLFQTSYFIKACYNV